MSKELKAILFSKEVADKVKNAGKSAIIEYILLIRSYAAR